MKSEIINLRVTEKLKRQLEVMAYTYQAKVSDLIRDILENRIAEEKRQQHTDKSDSDFLKSDEFLCLYSWLLLKQYNPFETTASNDLNRLKETLLTVSGHPAIPKEVRTEFEKILQDILRFLSEPDYQGKSFRFCIPNNYESVNYLVIINFMLNLHKPEIIYV